MLFLQVDPQVALISSLVVLLLVIISCISAKRFNFLHGSIVFFTLLSLLVGVDKILVSKDLITTNPTAAQVSMHLSACTALADPIYSSLVEFLKGQSFYASIEQYMYLIYFAPIALWLVSRLFAGIIRRSRRGY